MIRTVVLDVGETLTRDDRYWASWADRLDVPRHTLSALVGAVVVDGRDNADALRLLRPGLDVSAEYAAREAAGRGEQLDDTDLYEGLRWRRCRRPGFAWSSPGTRPNGPGRCCAAWSCLLIWS